MAPVLPSGENFSAGPWKGKTALRSSWIRRLKAWDESEDANENSDHSHHEVSLVAEGAGHPDPVLILGEVSERLSVQDAGESTTVGDTQRSDTVPSTNPDAVAEDQYISNFRVDCSSDARKQMQNENRHYDAVRENNGLAVGKESVARPFQSGFGPWVKLSSGSKLEEKPSSDAVRAEQSSKHAWHTSGPRNPSKVLVDSEQLEKRTRDDANDTLGLDKTVPKFSRVGTRAMGKPPLAPLRTGTSCSGKLGWAPRFISQNAQAVPFLHGSVDPVSRSREITVCERDRLDTQCVAKSVRQSMSRDVLAVTEVVDTNEEKFSPAHVETGTSLKFARSCIAFPTEHGAKDPEDRQYRSNAPATHVGNFAVTSETHQSVSFGKALPAVKFLSDQLSASHGEVSLYQSSSFAQTFMNSKVFERESSEDKDAASVRRVSSECRHAACFQRPLLDSVNVARVNKTPDTADLMSETAGNSSHLCFPNFGREIPKLVKTAEVVSPTAAIDVKTNASTPLSKVRAISLDTSEPSHGATRLEKADVGVRESPLSPSSSASFPWELFTEAAGSSRKARERFVEVYNKARDELKNQWTSRLVSRVADKNMVDTARLTSGQGACRADNPALMSERKSLESNQQVGQFQGNCKMLNGGLEPRYQYFGVDEPDQLASEQKGKFKALVEKKYQSSPIICKLGDKAALEAGIWQHVKPPVVRAFTTLNPGRSLLGDQLGQPFNGIISSRIQDLKKHNLLPIELQFRVVSKCSQGGHIHENKDCRNNFKKSSDAALHISCRGPIREVGECSHVQGAQSNNLIAKNYKDPTSASPGPPLKGLTVGGKFGGLINMQRGVFSLLGKRSRPVLEDGSVASNRACVAGKASVDGPKRLSNSIWLQRWHATCLNSKLLKER